MMARALCITFHLFVLLFGGVGWVNNALKLFDIDAFNAEFVARGAGLLLPPIGAIIGYF